MYDDDAPVCCNDYCGTPDSPVTWGPDPFAAEIRDDYTPIWECENCRYEHSMDV